VLGLFADAAYTTAEVKLSPGDLVMLFTDGLYEVEDRKNELLIFITPRIIQESLTSL